MVPVLGWTVREGLVLQSLTYDDRGTERPILHRAAISEMVVPYGDPSPTQFRKMAFDAGEVGLGLLAEQADARLRLPRRDPLLRRTRQRPGRQPNRA